jgi:glycosyltransferase involved in cell wall biosynthesis
MKLSIIIPCKNEEKYIGGLLKSLTRESLPKNTEIIIADAGSTDKTLTIINYYKHLLPNLSVINGGLPSVGRNAGANSATGDILLFLDADSYFKEPGIIKSSLLKILKGNELVGCLLNIEGNHWVRFIYFLCNMVIRSSKFDKPFVVGSYMMITKEAFNRVGGFDESLMHCEDYFLSEEINRKKFSVVNKYIYTDDRRFKKMGKLNLVAYFIKNMVKKNDKEYFKKDIGYWL